MSEQTVTGFPLDPRTKLFLWLCANVIVFVNASSIFPLVVILIYIFLLFLSKKGKTALVLAGGYAALIILQRGILPHLPAAVVTVLSTIVYFLLIFPCAASGAYLIATTTVSESLAALRRMHCPESLSVTFTVVLRYLPALKEELHHIRDAMRLRTIKGPMQKLECIYVPMLMGAAQSAEDISQSAMARGIDCPAPKSSYVQIGFHARDGFMILFFSALTAAAWLTKGVIL